MKETVASIAKNTTAMMASQIITWGSSLVLMIFLPRLLGPEDFGRLYFGLAITGLMFSVINLGIGDYFVKEVARNHAKVNSIFANALALRSIAWLVTFSIVIAYVKGTGNSGEVLLVVLILGFGTILSGLTDLAYRVFQSFERMEYRSVAVIIERVSLAIIGVTMLFMGYGTVAIATVMVFSTFLSCGAVLFLLPRVTRIDWEITTRVWPTLLRGGFPFLVTTGLSFFYYRVDVMMLSAMTNEAVVGWYGAPYRLFDTFGFFPSILGTAIFPVMARLWQNSKEDLAWTAQKVLNLTIVVAIPFAIILWFCAKPIVSLLFGFPQFANSVILLQILAATLPLLYIDFLFGTLLVTTDRQRYAPVVAAVALVVNIVLNYFLIPYCQQHYGNGAIGAAVTTVLTELAVSIMFFVLLPAGFFNRANVYTGTKSIVAGGGMAAAMYFMGAWMHYWYLVCLLGVGMYCMALLLMRVFSKQEVETFLGLIRLRALSEEQDG